MCRSELDRRNRTIGDHEIDGPRRGRAPARDGDRQLLDLPAAGAAGDADPRAPRAEGADRGASAPMAGSHTTRLASRARRRAHDRRLGLRRRRGHPGRPEGVRALRRARHAARSPRSPHRTRVASSAIQALPRGARARAGARGARRHRRGRGEGGDARQRRGDRARSRSALDELPAGTPVVVDPVMVAESGARLLARRRRGRADRGDPAARDACSHPTCPRRVRCSAGEPPRARARTRREALARAVLALGPRDRRAHRRAPRARGRPAPRRRGDGAGSSRSRASAIPTAPRTAPAARTPRCSPRSSRWGAIRWRRRASRAR